MSPITDLESKDGLPRNSYLTARLHSALVGNDRRFLQSAKANISSLLGSDGSLDRVGRILRIRSDLQSTAIYFDRVHEFQTTVSLSDVALTEPTGSIARLQAEDLARILTRDGISLSDVPIVQNVAYVRDLLEIAVRDDLLGPAGGPNELIKDMSVRDRYLVGKLAPRRPDDGETLGVEPASGADEVGDLKTRERPRSTSLEPSSRRHPVAWSLKTMHSTRSTPPTTNRSIPSSLGLTFCVAPTLRNCPSRPAGVAMSDCPTTNTKSSKFVRTVPPATQKRSRFGFGDESLAGGVVALSLVDGPIRPATPDHDQPDVRLQGTVRTNNKGERLITLFLVNGQIEPEDNKDRAWLFQPEILVEASHTQADKSVFLRRPANEVVVDDPERDRLALIYRDRLEFAVGHGVSVNAETRSVSRRRRISSEPK